MVIRDRVFLMTKINGRTKKGSDEATGGVAETPASTDRIDLVQHHESAALRRSQSHFRGGWRECGADRSARQEGKLRYIGFTGHKDPRIHLLHAGGGGGACGFLFDTAQMPLNVMDAHFRSFAKMVVPELVKQQYRRCWG